MNKLLKTLLVTLVAFILFIVFFSIFVLYFVINNMYILDHVNRTISIFAITFVLSYLIYVSELFQRKMINDALDNGRLSYMNYLYTKAESDQNRTDLRSQTSTRFYILEILSYCKQEYRNIKIFLIIYFRKRKKRFNIMLTQLVHYKMLPYYKKIRKYLIK